VHSQSQYSVSFPETSLSNLTFSRKATDGLFLATATEIAKEYPDIIFNDMIIDNCCMQVILSNVLLHELTLKSW
jgi:hypothetical protein